MSSIGTGGRSTGHWWWPEPRPLGVRKYQQVHTLDQPELHAALQRRNGGSPEPFDGIAEIWVEDVDGFRNGSGSPESRQAAQELLEDEANFIDLANSPMWLGEEVVFVDQTAEVDQ